jgi:hypothetical protein
MKNDIPFKIKSYPELFDFLPENERLIVDILCAIIRENLPSYCKQKISYNVPFFYGNRSICLVWPATVPRGGIKEGVLLGFWYGSSLNDADSYLTHGTNKQIFYKIFKDPVDIDEKALGKILMEAVQFDELKSKRKS